MSVVYDDDPVDPALLEAISCAFPRRDLVAAEVFRRPPHSCDPVDRPEGADALLMTDAESLAYVLDLQDAMRALRDCLHAAVERAHGLEGMLAATKRNNGHLCQQLRDKRGIRVNVD